MRLRAILDHANIMFSGERKNRVHITWPAGEMDRNDCLRPRRQRWTNRIDAHGLADTIYIDNHGCCAYHDCATGGRDERAARDNDLIPGTDFQDAQSKFQCDGAVCNRNRMLPGCERPELSLKLNAFGSGPIIDLSRPKHRKRGSDFVFTKTRPRRKGVAPNRGPAIDRKCRVANSNMRCRFGRQTCRDIWW